LVFDPNTKTFLNADSLLIAAQAWASDSVARIGRKRVPIARVSMSRIQPRLCLWVAVVATASISIPLPVRGQDPKRSVVDSGPQTLATLQPGPYFALVIGNNNYRYLNKLQTAVNDAKEVAQLLHEHYGFSTKVLYDATRDDILTALVEYRRTLPDKSNLLIYYAGHGHNDREADEAYWLPVDAQKDNNENWISADDITRDVRAIPSQHVLIISDSCYSGSLTREADVAINPRDQSKFLARMWSSKSRTLMASGSDEPVADGGCGGHSVFACAILQGLQTMPDSAFTAAALFQKVQPRVAGRSEQLPQYNLIRNSGHNFGDFVFSHGGQAFTASLDTTAIHGGDIDLHLGELPDGAGNLKNLSSGVGDVDAIKKVLDLYQQAYNYRDATALWKIWPNSPGKTKQAIENAFKSAASIKMNLQVEAPNISPDGQSATVRGQFSQLFVPRNGSAQPSRTDDILFSFKRDGGIWVIADVK
jgi:Caspase domain